MIHPRQQMKKLFALLLILAYGVSSFGMTLHMHYCCGKLDKISLSSKVSAGSKFETSVQGKSCCGDKEYQLKIKVDQEAGSKQVSSYSIAPVVLFPAYGSNVLYFQKTTADLPSTGPPLSQVPLFIKYCIYRI